MIQEKMRGMIQAAGFVDVVETKYRWPIGAWSTDPRWKDVGRWNMHHWKEGMEGWTMALLTRVMGVSGLFGRSTSHLALKAAVVIRGCQSVEPGDAEGDEESKEPCLPRCVGVGRSHDFSRVLISTQQRRLRAKATLASRLREPFQLDATPDRKFIEDLEPSSENMPTNTTPRRCVSSYLASSQTFELLVLIVNQRRPKPSRRVSSMSST